MARFTSPSSSNVAAGQSDSAYERRPASSRMFSAGGGPRLGPLDPVCHQGDEAGGIVEDEMVPGALELGELAARHGGGDVQHGGAVHHAAAFAAHDQRGTGDLGKDGPVLGSCLSKDLAVKGVVPDPGRALDDGDLAEVTQALRGGR